MYSQICWIFVLLLQIYSYTINIKLKQGKLIGTREESVYDGRIYHSFYGVPYAQPPVGKLRFKDPELPKKWEKPFDATIDYRGACAQAHIVHKHAMFGVEDCLYMNIFTPLLTRNAESKLKPVLVYIHGYAFTSSLSHVYGPDFFIEKDIIFISVTHRIGVFGFLKVIDTDPHANMGLKDIVMALKWIRKNIEKFGGDINKITVMGNDSGATFLSLLLMTKHRKLFSKIILHSGAVFSPSLFHGNYTIERERLKQNLQKMGIKDIIKATSQDIITASLKIYSSKEYINFQKPIVPFTPVLEKKSSKSLLMDRPDEFYSMLKGQNLTKNMIIGFNSRESISEMIPFIHNPQYIKPFASHFKFMVPFSDGCIYNYTTSSYEQVATKIKSFYFKQDISEKSLNEFLQYTTDLKVYPIWKFIQAHLYSKRLKMFVYKFDYVGAFNAVKMTSVAGANTKIKGASNGDELCYMMKCEPLKEAYIKLNNDTNNRDRIFMAEISELWANFVKTGNPMPNSQTTQTVWQPMSFKQNNILHLGKVMKLVSAKSERKMYQFWNEVYKSIYSKNHCNKIIHEEL